MYESEWFTYHSSRPTTEHNRGLRTPDVDEPKKLVHLQVPSDRLYIEYQPDDPGSSLCRQKTRKADEVEGLLLPPIYFLQRLLFPAHQYDLLTADWVTQIYV